MIFVPANIFTLIGAFIFFMFGITYFYKSKSVKNHCNTAQKSLEQVSKGDRIIKFALMRGAGGGAIAIAVFTACFQWQYSKHSVKWIPLAIVLIDLLFYLPSLNAMILVTRNTTLRPPVFLLSLGMFLIILGYFLNIQISNG
jgi:hypothetical protein